MTLEAAPGEAVADGGALRLGVYRGTLARTALELVAEGRPFTDILTTQRFMMTTALKSMYMQIEMPYDIHTFNFQFNHGTRPALTDTLISARSRPACLSALSSRFWKTWPS